MAITAAAFATNVAALSITVTKADGSTGALSIKALTDLPPAILARDCPVLYPRFNYQTGLSYEIVSTGTSPLMEKVWTANYYFAQAQIGEARFAQAHANTIALNVDAIAAAIMAATFSLGVKHVEFSEATDPDMVPGPDETKFHGCALSLTVHDWLNTA